MCRGSRSPAKAQTHNRQQHCCRGAQLACFTGTGTAAGAAAVTPQPPAAAASAVRAAGFMTLISECNPAAATAAAGVAGHSYRPGNMWHPCVTAVHVIRLPAAATAAPALAPAALPAAAVPKWWAPARPLFTGAAAAAQVAQRS